MPQVYSFTAGPGVKGTTAWREVSYKRNRAAYLPVSTPVRRTAAWVL